MRDHPFPPVPTHLTESIPTAMNRRSMMTVAGVAAVQIWMGTDMRAVLEAQERAHTANALLHTLPKQIDLGGGAFADVEISEVPGARFLLVAIRNVHELDPRKMTPDVRAAKDASDREVGTIIQKLLQTTGISVIAPEGVTQEDVIALAQKKATNQAAYEKRVRDLVPYGGIADLVSRGKVRIAPAETVEARATAKKAAENPRLSPYVGAWIREGAALELVTEHAPKEAPGIIAIWGAAHWVHGKGKTLPVRVDRWNSQPTHVDQQFSTAIITPPSTVEFLTKHPLPDLPEGQ